MIFLLAKVYLLSRQFWLVIGLCLCTVFIFLPVSVKHKLQFLYLYFNGDLDNGGKTGLMIVVNGT